MNPLVALILAIVIISAVVGVIAQFLNKLNEVNAPPAGRRPGPPGGPRPAQTQADRDMDRFLAEIERLRKKNAPGGDGQPTPAEPVSPPVAKVVTPTEKTRPRIVAEPVTAAPQSRPRLRSATDEQGFVIPATTATPKSEPADRREELPVATVVDLATVSPKAPPTPIRKIVALPHGRAASRSEFAKNFAALLGSGQGVAMAVVLREVLGPPKCKQ